MEKPKESAAEKESTDDVAVALNVKRESGTIITHSAATYTSKH